VVSGGSRICTVAIGGNHERQQTVGTRGGCLPLSLFRLLGLPIWCHCPYSSQHLLKRTASRAVHGDHHHYPRNCNCSSADLCAPARRTVPPHGSCSRHQRPIPYLSSHSHQSTHSTHPARSLPVSAAVGVWFCSAPRLPPRRSMDEASEGVVAAAALFMRGRVRMLMMAPRTIVALRQG
jgi:hypothetical protein